MFSQIFSAATFGVDAYLVNVETHLDLRISQVLDGRLA